MIIVTGVAGFVASVVVKTLVNAHYNDLVLVDDFAKYPNSPNLGGLEHLPNLLRVERTALPAFIDDNHHYIQCIIHLGARTDTTEQSTEIFDTLNLHYSQALWNQCVAYGLPLIYASSAATYGAGELGYDDKHDTISQLQPLNPYGWSKQQFDTWALQQPRKPYYWIGLKFFNVFGPNEYHKGRMASVVWHAHQQILESQRVRLFRSHKPGIADGEQQRDFIYVLDVASAILWFLQQEHRSDISGIYNLGSGHARTFLDLVHATFAAHQLPPAIDWVDTPLDIRASYQYYTQANVSKLRAAGYHTPFTDLESAIADYITSYALPGRYF